jgi:polysaccharide export outer membrane protein
LEANQEATVYRIESEVARLRIEAGDLGFKLQQVQSTFDRQAATQLQEIRDRLKDLDVTLPAAIRMRDVKLRYAGNIAPRDAKHSITITRTRNSKTDVLNADETTLVEPGDIIDVETTLPGSFLSSSAQGGASADLSASGSEGTEQVH